jgi:hypothetical protein
VSAFNDPINLGSQGPRGPQGLGVLSGTAAPAANLGRVGEFYHQLNGQGEVLRIFGPKTDAGWGAGYLMPSTADEQTRQTNEAQRQANAAAQAAAEAARVAAEQARGVGETTRQTNEVQRQVAAAAQAAAAAAQAAAESIRVISENERRQRVSLQSTRNPAYRLARIIDAANPTEPAPIVTGTTATRDVVAGYNPTELGWRIEVLSAGQREFEWDLRSNPVVFGRAQALQLVCDTPAGAGNLTSLTIQIRQTAGTDQIWSRSIFAAPQGTVRIPIFAGTPTDNWGTAHIVKVVIQCTGPLTLHWRRLAAEVKESPEVMVITDGADPTVFDPGGFYDRLKARNIPLEMALLPGLFGQPYGTHFYPTWQFLQPYLRENRNVVSAHSRGVGTLNSAMTAAEIREESAWLISWFAANRLPRPFIRTAWLQNTAPQHAAAQPFWYDYASPSAKSTLELWPPEQKWNISRVTLSGRSQATYADWIDRIGRTNALLVCYIHGIDTLGGIHITPTEMNNFFTELDRGIATYGIKGTNQFELVERLGVRYELTARGDTVLIERNAAGVEVPKLLYS